MKEIKQGRLFSVGMVIMLAALFLLPAVQAQPLVPPCTWQGTVTFDGSAVANGTLIRAKVGAAVVGNTTTSGAAYVMLVPQVDGVPAEGATVNFYVVIAGTEYLGGSDTWNSGELKQLNLVASTGGVPPPPLCEDSPAVAVGLASIYSHVVGIYGYYPGEGVGGLGWTLYKPEWATSYPHWNTLTNLRPGRGYWVMVNADCQLSYGTWNTAGKPLAAYNLKNGWNLIGWMGC